MAPQCHPSVTAFPLQPSFSPSSPFPPSAPFNIFRSRFTIPEIKRKIYSASHVRALRTTPTGTTRPNGNSFRRSFWPFAVHSFFEREQKERKRKKRRIFHFSIPLCFSFFFFFSSVRKWKIERSNLPVKTHNNYIYIFDTISIEFFA